MPNRILSYSKIVKGERNNNSYEYEFVFPNRSLSYQKIAQNCDLRGQNQTCLNYAEHEQFIQNFD